MPWLLNGNVIVNFSLSLNNNNQLQNISFKEYKAAKQMHNLLRVMSYCKLYLEIIGADLQETIGWYNG